MKLEKHYIKYFKKKYGATIGFEDNGYVFVKLRNNHLALPIDGRKYTDIFQELTEFCEECDRKHARQREELTKALLKAYPNSRYLKVLKEVA